jgi:hypothetical protein
MLLDAIHGREPGKIGRPEGEMTRHPFHLPVFLSALSWRCVRWWVAFGIAVLAVLLPSSAEAHGMRSAYLEVAFVRAGEATVHLRVTANDPELQLRTGEGCALAPAGEGGSPYDRFFVLTCKDGSAAPWIEVTGLGPVVSDAVAYVSLADGTTRSKILTPDDSRAPLVRTGGRLDVLYEYVGFGTRHILSGADHLLFLFLLVLWVKEWRKVLLCETAFTLSHSLSFSATALGWIRVSPLAAEACIALSLLLLALDANREAHVPNKWHAALMALLFGLVHGLGFAGGLREIGLPDHAVGIALLGFGAGVEVGQIAFLASLLAILYAANRLRFIRIAELGLVYAAGSLSAYWLLVRSLACFGYVR